MREIFKIIRIDEPDFGCEGLPDGQPLKDEVTIETESGNQYIMHIEDALLYKLELNEGDSFFVGENGDIEKYVPITAENTH